jgi:hypothetical protein
MPKMLSALSTISQWKPVSAIAEFPRDSRKRRIAEASAASAACTCESGALADGAAFSALDWVAGVSDTLEVTTVYANRDI